MISLFSPLISITATHRLTRISCSCSYPGFSQCREVKRVCRHRCTISTGAHILRFILSAHPKVIPLNALMLSSTLSLGVASVCKKQLVQCVNWCSMQLCYKWSCPLVPETHCLHYRVVQWWHILAGRPWSKRRTGYQWDFLLDFETLQKIRSLQDQYVILVQHDNLCMSTHL